MEHAKIFHRDLNLQYQCDYMMGWLPKFKMRHSIVLYGVCSEKRRASVAVLYIIWFEAGFRVAGLKMLNLYLVSSPNEY